MASEKYTPAWRRIGLKLQAPNNSVANADQGQHQSTKRPFNREDDGSSEPRKKHQKTAKDTKADGVKEVKSSKALGDAERRQAFEGRAAKEGSLSVSDNKSKPESQDTASKKLIRRENTPRDKKTIEKYLAYLTASHSSRDQWKFNKALQTQLLKDILNLHRIPSTYGPALISYIQGLQGQNAKDRLKEHAQTVLTELDSDSEVKQCLESERTKSDQAVKGTKIGEFHEAMKTLVARFTDCRDADPMDDPARRAEYKQAALRKDKAIVKRVIQENNDAARARSADFIRKFQQRQRALEILLILSGGDEADDQHEGNGSREANGNAPVKDNLPAAAQHQGQERNGIRKKSRGRKRRRVTYLTGVPEDDETSSSSSSSSEEEGSSKATSKEESEESDSEVSEEEMQEEQEKSKPIVNPFDDSDGSD